MSDEQQDGVEISNLEISISSPFIIPRPVFRVQVGLFE
jgi:hypothetical protein